MIFFGPFALGLLLLAILFPRLLRSVIALVGLALFFTVLYFAHGYDEWKATQEQPAAVSSTPAPDAPLSPEAQAMLDAAKVEAARAKRALEHSPPPSASGSDYAIGGALNAADAMIPQSEAAQQLQRAADRQFQ